MHIEKARRTAGFFVFAAQAAGGAFGQSRGVGAVPAPRKFA
jgi:hypothetical protein